MVNFSSLTAEICCRVFGTPANLNGFRLLAVLLHRRRLTEVNQTLHDVWYTIYAFVGALAPNRVLPGAKFTLCPSLTFSYIGTVTARHLSSWHQPNFAAWYKEWNYGTFTTEGATYIPRAAITLGIRPHSSILMKCSLVGWSLTSLDSTNTAISETIVICCSHC